MTAPRGLISTRDAAGRLGIKVETLYAYASRGLITAQQVPGERGSYYDPADVAKLGQKGRMADKRPVLAIESKVTLIENGHFWYRGIDPFSLLGTTSYETTAELLWGSEDWREHNTHWPIDHDTSTAARQALKSLPIDTPPFDRLRTAASVISAMDLLRFDLSASAAKATARRMISTLVDALRPTPIASEASIAERLLGALRTTEPSRAETAAVNAALILFADHELAASTMSVRTAAAFKADPHSAVAAGLGALAGARHGGATAAAEALLREAAFGDGARRAIGRRVRDGTRVPGLGQPLYQKGDPRAPALFAAARRAAPSSRVHGALDEVILLSEERGFPHPNGDLGLAAIAASLELEPGSGEVIFAIARMAGWVAHAIEEYENPSNMRPRAVYVGVRP